MSKAWAIAKKLIMKKWVLCLLTLVPVILYHLIFKLPWISVTLSLQSYILPWIIFIFWLWLGGRFAASGLRFVPAVLLGNLIGFLCIAVYFFQNWFISDATTQGALIAFSLSFSGGIQKLPLNIPEKILEWIVKSQGNATSYLSVIGVEIAGLIFMILVFSIGFLWKKGKMKDEKQA